MNATQILTGAAGNNVLALTLSALNFELGRQLVSHPSLKMPVINPDRSPDQFRDLVRLPEMEAAQPDQIPADILADGVVATCGLAYDLARLTDFNERGGLIRPFAWIVERVKTPLEVISQHYSWRSEQAGKMAREQCALIGLSDKADAISKAAQTRTDHEQASRRDYAMAEVESITRPGLLKADPSELVAILESIEEMGAISSIVKVAANAAAASIERTKARLVAGQFARVDEEVVLFAQTHAGD